MEELTYEEIHVGDQASFTKTISESDIYQFAGITGDFNPLHVNKEFASHSQFKERIAHGILTAGFISSVLGMKLPGVNSIYLSQSLKFVAPVKIDDTITAKVTVLEKLDKKKIILLQTIVVNQRGETVIEGDAAIMKNI